MMRAAAQAVAPAENAPLHIGSIETPVGCMAVAATARGICLLEFSGPERLDKQLARLRKIHGAAPSPGETAVMRQMRAQLDAYFAGTLREFTIPLDIAGTPFQQKVWGALRGIAYGETCSYADLAKSIGAPSAVRAVARANGDNPVSIVIPCHRVIGSDGALTGYGGGLWRKRALLEREGAAAQTALSL